ncbi:tetratricopeptide repeat protein [Candidatus Foliamicus sp.]
MKSNTLRLGIAALFVSLGMLALPAAAQVGYSPGGTAEAKVIGDHVLVRVVFSTEKFHKETHMVLDYTDEQPLRIYNCILGYVEYGEGEETIKILADGMRIEVPREDVEASAECTLFLKNLSGQYSVELKDVDVSAILGGPVLRQFALGMNLAEGQVSFTPAAEASAADAQLWAESIITGLRTTKDGRVLAPLSVGDRDRSLMAFNTAGYHSYVNAALAGGLGYPFGDVPDIYFGAGDQRVPLSGMAALFPADFSQDPELSSDWLLVPGLSLWTAFRLEINPLQGYLALEPVVNTNYSEADFEFYSAAATRDRDALRTFHQNNPEDRNVAEAAELMFALGLEENAPVEEQMEAVNYRLATTLDRMKSDWLKETLEPLFLAEDRDERSELIVALAEEALEHVSRSDNPALRQDLQLMLGDRYLQAGDAEQAWKYFLAAGFSGDPEKESLVRHELGRVYEALGRYRRAYSNYERAASPLLEGPEALKDSARAGMERVKPSLEADDPLLVEAGS